jgi:hypothetical protein
VTKAAAANDNGLSIEYAVETLLRLDMVLEFTGYQYKICGLTGISVCFRLTWGNSYRQDDRRRLMFASLEERLLITLTLALIPIPLYSSANLKGLPISTLRCTFSFVFGNVNHDESGPKGFENRKCYAVTNHREHGIFISSHYHEISALALDISWEVVITSINEIGLAIFFMRSANGRFICEGAPQTDGEWADVTLVDQFSKHCLWEAPHQLLCGDGLGLTSRIRSCTARMASAIVLFTKSTIKQ